MTKYDDMNVLIDDFDATTNELSASIDALIADINHTASAGMTGPQVENTLTRLTAYSSRLKSIAANAANPIPPAPPDPVEPMPGPFGEGASPDVMEARNRSARGG